MTQMTLRNAFQILAASYPGHSLKLGWAGRGRRNSMYIATATPRDSRKSTASSPCDDPLDALRELLANLAEADAVAVDNERDLASGKTQS